MLFYCQQKTPHHFFFINEISKNCNLSIIFENESLKPVFNVHNNFEKKQLLYEKKYGLRIDLLE